MAGHEDRTGSRQVDCGEWHDSVWLCIIAPTMNIIQIHIRFKYKHRYKHNCKFKYKYNSRYKYNYKYQYKYRNNTLRAGSELGDLICILRRGLASQ